MSFGGSVHAAIISMKNNRALLGKKRTYRMLKEHLIKEYTLKAHNAKNAYLDKKIPKAELEEIKRKIRSDLRKQNRRANLLIYSSTVIVLIILAAILFY